MTLAAIYALTDDELREEVWDIIGLRHPQDDNAIERALDWLAGHVGEPFHVTHSLRRPSEMTWMIRLGGSGVIGYSDSLQMAVMRAVLIVNGGS